MHLPGPLHYFRVNGPDRVALVNVTAAPGTPGSFTLQVSRGPNRRKLGVTTTITPVPSAALEGTLAKLAADLELEGFLPAGVQRALQALQSPKAAARARAALRLGGIGHPAAVAPLLALGANGTEELASVVDALGRLGDPRALPLCRAEAERKLLSRRRSGVEALRRLGDSDGLTGVRVRALDRLPQPVRNAVLVAESTGDPADQKALEDAVGALPNKDQGLALDTLYELASGPAVAAVKAALGTSKLGVPYLWRAAKSVFKRAMLRGDAALFGFLAWRLEKARSEPGSFAVLKSGLDGKDRPTRVFQKNTRLFVRRLAWRHLRELARSAPERYAPTAAEVLVQYSDADRDLKAKFPAWEWSGCHLLHRILWGASKRFAIDDRSLRFRYATKTASFTADPSEELAFAALWDRSPGAFLRLAAAGRLRVLHELAVRALSGPHRGTLEGAPHEAVVAMLGAPFEPTVDLAAAELGRRFDPVNPDWSLLQTLLSDKRPRVLELSRQCLEACSARWTLDLERSLALLGHEDAALRALVAALVVQALDDNGDNGDNADPFYRRELAERILAVLMGPEPSEGAFEAYARVAREALGPELDAVLGLDEVLALLDKSSGSLQAVCGTLLGRKPEALQRLGVDRLAGMGNHAVASVRQAAQHLLRAAIDQLKDDPSVLFTMCESDWADTRGVALELLKTRVDLEALGIDGLVGLCDSNRADVQALGRELILRHFEHLEPAEVVKRLSQHPHPTMRRFAVDLVVAHLRPGFVALASVETFLRTALLDLWPSRREKRTVLDFLEERGLADENQAELAARLLGEFARTRGRADFDRAMEALVRLRLRYPEAPSALSLAAPTVEASP
ncbi:MAG: hypothetical protein HY909_05645 [Deltaproteobacteria bacterium]|nr:hypothetical protein [Deltaproteobacteria bacterium]